MNHKCYRCVRNLGRIYIAWNVVFDENYFPFISDPLFKTSNQSQSQHTQNYHMQLLSVLCVSSDFDFSARRDSTLTLEQNTT